MTLISKLRSNNINIKNNNTNIQILNDNNNNQKNITTTNIYENNHI